jgi:glycyl-tRNA synthetase
MLDLYEHPAAHRAHYSKRTVDIEYKFPFGQSELWGHANRTDFDLSQHAKFSGEELDYFDEETKEHVVPYVIEPSMGVDRLMLVLLLEAYDEQPDKEGVRTVLHFHPRIAPVKAAVLPLVAKDAGMVEKARALFEELRGLHVVEYDEGGAIGRRYRRQDEIGTPFAFTIDEQTLADDTVTIRDRDSLAQERLAIGQAAARLGDELRKPWSSPKTD